MKICTTFLPSNPSIIYKWIQPSKLWMSPTNNFQPFLFIAPHQKRSRSNAGLPSPYWGSSIRVTVTVPHSCGNYICNHQMFLGDSFWDDQTQESMGGPTALQRITGLARGPDEGGLPNVTWRLTKDYIWPQRNGLNAHDLVQTSLSSIIQIMRIAPKTN